MDHKPSARSFGSAKSTPTLYDQRSPALAKANQEKKANKGWVHWVKNIWPEWVTTNIRSKRSLKLLLRASLACWLGYVVMLPHAALHELGPVAFFVLMHGFFVPAYLPVQLFFFLMTTIMVGICFNWGFGAAAMRAATASRDPSRLQAAVARVTEAFNGNQALATQFAIYHGWFLDKYSSAVFGCFLGVGAFLMALVRAYAPTLIFLSVLGTIALDIFCTIGPLIPYNRLSILESMAKSVAVYFGIALLVTIFVFPESMNHAILTSISAQFGRVREMIAIQDEVLAFGAEDIDSRKEVGEKTRKARTVLIGLLVMATSRFIHLEFSWGKWNGDDVLDILQPLLTLVTRISVLQSFEQVLCTSQHIFDTDQLPPDTNNEKADATDTYLIRQIQQLNKEVETEHRVRLQDILPVLDTATKALRTSCLAALDTTKRSIDHINENRYRRKRDLDNVFRDAHDAATADLRTAVRGFKEDKRLQLLAPFAALLDNQKLASAMPLRSLYISYVFSAGMLSVSEAALDLMVLVGDTMERRKNNRLWAPKGLRKIWKILRARGDENNGVLGEDVSPHPTGEDVVDEDDNYRRDPDARAPKNLFQKLIHVFFMIYKWTRTAEFVFAVKYVVVTIALWIPCVVSATARFYYAEKCIWALIMAQTMINLYAADHIFNLLTRFVGTIVGCGLALAIWYLGNVGLRAGNPYGSAVVLAAFLPPIMFVRLYAPVKYLQGTVLGGATIALILGYSWIDGHAELISNPSCLGVGWDPAWKRFLLVIVGCGAAAIVMLFPPTSGRKAVRLRNASSIAALSRLYGYLMSTWISDDTEGLKDVWVDKFRKQIMSSSVELRTIRELTDMAKWEGSIRGAWAIKEYRLLAEAQLEMVASLAQLGSSLLHLDDSWRVEFSRQTGVLNPNFIADVMGLFTLVSQSLRTAEPLPEVLPNSLLEKLFYHQENHAPSIKALNIEHIQTVDYMYYAAGIVAVYQIMHSLDTLQRITKNLCGEVPLKGFDRWRTQFERSRDDL
ncbi:hypothetical protein CYLTODRAFT_483276 [Cylindrobasidium torrendii FP15055 ss-10]|uniref:ER transporter 6TM N-terminal domain-containing protein n=1 Tax=Cylindrobasidium torrendii FP15055 ss-10 TaxID=1314674 RepID=A0A0D7BDQ7_9AGAR|nr:hypothetical protein CYLTODRAFT_483276 [Cylindrobasidium torrendii FP15055 ss-10]